jgi:hypothetical protein
LFRNLENKKLKKLLFLVILAACVSCLLASGCAGKQYILGTGPIVTQKYDFSSFDKIEISNAFTFEISQSEDYTLTVSARQNIIEYLDISKSGDTLRIRMKNRTYSNTETKAVITLPELTRLIVSGASSGTVKGFDSDGKIILNADGASRLDLDIQTGDLQMDVSGASKVSGSLVADNARFRISGASSGNLAGYSAKSKIELSGASNFTSPDFRMTAASVNIGSASSAEIYVETDLDVSISGASTLIYEGEAVIGDFSVSGGSRVEHR